MRSYIKAVAGNITNHTLRVELFFFEATDPLAGMTAVRAARDAFGARGTVSVWAPGAMPPGVPVDLARIGWAQEVIQ